MKHRRNFLPTFLLTIIIWLTWISVLFFFAPQTKLLILAFYFLFWLANFLTFSLILGNSRWGFLISFGIIAYLFLRQIKQDHILNFVLLGGIVLSIELYFRKR